MKQLYTLVGMKYRHTERLVADMARGTGLTLKRAPDNPHDPSAVEVWYAGEHIAFIKATEVRELAGMMDRLNLASVNGIFAVSADRWPQVEIDTR